MPTTRSFSTMLNEYVNNEMLFAESIKRNYVLSKVEIDESWKGGQLIVPMESAMASSVEFGQLAGSTDVAEYAYLRGTVASPIEVWGTMVFNHTDLIQHDGKMPEDGFLKILPNQLDRFLGYVKEVVSISLTSGPHFAVVTADTNLAGGIVAVDKIDRFYLGQKVSLDDDNSSPQTCYVTAIDLNTKQITVSATRGGAALDISAYTLAQNSRFYYPGLVAGGSGSFESLRSAFLSSANGGGSTIHGLTKTASPATQAINIDGASVNASNILDKIFDGYTEVRSRGRGNATEVLMSYKHLGSIMKLLEVQKGGYMVTKSAEANLYGWTSIGVQTVKGQLTLTGILEMPDAEIFYVDWNSLKFCTNGGFRKRKSPDGTEYFEVRATTGYSYLVDMCMYGALVHRAPSNNGVLYNIPNY